MTLPQLTPAAQTTLTTWSQAASGAYADNTTRAWRADTQAFSTWCEAQGVDALPAAPELVARYLRDQAEGRVGKAKRVASLRRYAASIAKLHRAAGLADPCAAEPVRLALRAVARAKGTDQRQAQGLTQRDTARIQARLGAGLKDCRDLALLLVARDTLARASELVALDVEHVTELGVGGGLVTLRRTKTSTDTQTCFLGPDACRALAEWLARSGLKAGPLFTSVTKGEGLGGRLSTRDVGRRLKDLAHRAGLDHAAGVSGHSCRVGMAQDLVAAGLDVASVQQAGGWASSVMVARYTRKLAARRGAVAAYYSKT